jgi:hypothetical protein
LLQPLPNCGIKRKDSRLLKPKRFADASAPSTNQKKRNRDLMRAADAAAPPPLLSSPHLRRRGEPAMKSNNHIDPPN